MLQRLVVVVVVMLALAPAASAALDARLSLTPTTPTTGERVTIFIRPYWTYSRADGTCCRLVPADVRYPFRLQFLSQGRASEIRAHRTSDALVWRGRFRFPAADMWHVRLTNYYYDQKCKRIRCVYNGPELVVRVR